MFVVCFGLAAGPGSAADAPLTCCIRRVRCVSADDAVRSVLGCPIPAEPVKTVWAEWTRSRPSARLSTSCAGRPQPYATTMTEAPLVSDLSYTNCLLWTFPAREFRIALS